jgi:hypothetical protein
MEEEEGIGLEITIAGRYCPTVHSSEVRKESQPNVFGCIVTTKRAFG